MHVSSEPERYPRHHCIAALLAALLLLTAPVAVEAATPLPAEPPDGYQLSLLIYSTLTALDQANATGNYTVLRQLAAPSFQSINSADALAGTFLKYRRQRVVLAPVVLYQPTLTTEPRIGSDGLLQLKGYFPTRPLRIGFELAYQWVNGAWRLIAMSIVPSGT